MPLNPNVTCLPVPFDLRSGKGSTSQPTVACMANPKNWFRRRRPTLLGGSEQDPFADESVLDLGRGAVMLRDPATAMTIPPPKRAAEGGRLIRSSAFSVRPELNRRTIPSAAAGTAVRPAPSPLRVATPPKRREAEAAPGPRETEAAPNPIWRIQAERRRDERTAAPERPAPPERPGPTSPTGTGTARAAKPTGEKAAFSLAAPGPTWLRGRVGQEEASRFNALLRDAF